MLKKLSRIALIFIFTVFAFIFVAKFAGPRLLRLYVEAGMGNCQKTPIFCLMPQIEIKFPRIDQSYLDSLAIYKFSGIQIRAPKEFKVIKQKVTRTYFKKWQPKSGRGKIYLINEPGGFFPSLFPQFKKEGIISNYLFLSRIVNAHSDEIQTLDDAFFVVMKGVFTPDLGDMQNTSIIKFYLAGKKGFISYDLGKKENYFDCDIMDDDDRYFKVYIKDTAGILNLNKVLTIISGVEYAP